MKVIDLLNKIANGEEIPNKFKFAQEIFIRYGTRYEDEDGYYLFDSCCPAFSNINDEIEIIEEDKPIEKILVNYQDSHSQEEINEYLRWEINELIEEINKLKKEKENEQ